MSFLRRISLMLLLALTACGPKTGPTSLPTITPTFPPAEAITPSPTPIPVPAAAIVNGETVPLADYDAELARFKAAQTELGTQASDDAAKQQVMAELVDEFLLAQAAYQAGFNLDDAALDARIASLANDVGGADQLSAWMQAQGYTEAGFRSTLRRQLAAAWMRDQIIAGVSSNAEQVHVQQILIYNGDRAQNVLAQLQAGSDFGDLAALFDPVTNGDLGWFPRGYLLEPAIEEAAFKLQPGEMSGVIETPVGFHIIKVIERGERALAPDAYLALQEKALTEWLAQQRQSSAINLAP